MVPENIKPNIKNSFLLHVCCANCALYPYFYLSENYRVTLFFYNPNIQPISEYKRRLKDVKQISKIYNIPLITGEYDVREWIEKTYHLKDEPEKGKRCYLCYKIRLKKTAYTAKKLTYHLFGTTLTISPHKDHEIINRIGKALEFSEKIIYFESNFKKRDGFKKTLELSKKLNIYHQNYCGCIYSKNNI